MSKQVTNSGVTGFNALYLGSVFNLAIGASANSVSIPVGTLMRFVATADCYVAVGPSAVATSSSMLLPAGIVDYIGLQTAGDSVSVLQVSAAGNLNIMVGG